MPGTRGLESTRTGGARHIHVHARPEDAPRSDRRRAVEPGLGDANTAKKLRGPGATEELPPIGRVKKKNGEIVLGKVGKDRTISMSPAGRFLIEGKIADAPRGSAREGLALYYAAKLAAERGGIFDKMPMNAALRKKVLANLIDTIEGTFGPPRTILKDKAFAGAMSLLIGLADDTPAGDAKTRREAIDAALTNLGRTKDLEFKAFYLLSLIDLAPVMTAEQRKQLRAMETQLLPARPLVEEYTANRTRPLEVRHHIHPEFWKEELAAFTKKNGWELVKKNAKDDFREYRAVLKDPTGKKKPLEVHMTVKKDELDFLADMDDPKTHVILYSGHSSVGGNGSQSIQAAGKMVGEHPKLVLAANCRGKDNYAEFTNKWPSAHVIMTEHPTYSDSGQSRIKALFEALARGESYAWMRGQTEEAWWDEPAKNYFYPDEKRKFRFMDADEDGKVDESKLGLDRLFDVDLDRAGGKFMRALNFTNSELFYHWEVDDENGKKSHFGRKYGDSLIADGPIGDPKPGELVRVSEVKGENGTSFRVRYNAEIAARMDQNVLGGHVTAQVIMALSKMRAKNGELTKHEALRAALMGAQAVHYLDVYTDTSPVTYKRYLRDIGFDKEIDPDQMEKLFEKYDAHANDEQVEGFRKLLTETYKIDLEKWEPKLRGKPVIV